ncbi:DEAD/DEAH box helicase [Haliea sp. AH-315-K21]|uniref:DEAD-box ATP-dependent RNA helicase RhpA n=1 Tax=SAR86 cluster bacterium TaxID=2030880 RepID=A0A2A5C8G0_9GAMM|nr:DEAD/DEAH box helicase [Haliea sp. AH-315-K21]PCJ40174.1 MAG: ATP-dependent RNA helicase [SAR86 cluster bacterium]
MSFNTLGLSETLLLAVQETGYTHPTPIQVKSIPAILTGKDLMAAAQTGTGKTAGFTLPLLQLLGGKSPVRSNRCHALVLTPTRELAAQIQESIQTYGKNEALRSTVVFGGVNINPQMKALRRGVDILVATPGRLLDLHQQNAIKFTDVEVLILDEADRMLDMGFIRDIRKILAMLPRKRQNLMFSATFSNEIRTLAKTICSNPIEIDVAPRNSTVQAISQKLYKVPKEHKAALLTHLLSKSNEQTLVFSRTKHGANKLAKQLNRANITASAIHGNKSQNQRTKALADFKQNKVQVLVATDIAARGIDIDLLAQVINFDLPHVPEDYVHRIGRTGRAGASGVAISLVSPDETKQLRAIERLIKFTITVEEIDNDFDPGINIKTQESRQAPSVNADKRTSHNKPRRHKPSPSGGKNKSKQANKAKSYKPKETANNAKTSSSIWSQDFTSKTSR